MVKVLVFNSGSSSVKYEVFAVRDWTSLASGLVERIGEPESRLRHRGGVAGDGDSGEGATGNGATQIARSQVVPDHRSAVRLVSEVLREFAVLRDPSELCAIGHRVVHGGEAFREPTVIDEEVIATIRAQIPLAPLHNPANVVGIEAAMAAYPRVPQVAVFDTTFHQSLPPHAYRYAIPEEVYRDFGVRRYGFHGTSHSYVARQAAKHLDRPMQSLNLVTLHVGNGASAAAIRNGKSIDTSMGITPLEGLIMGTRCGDLDPAIVFYLARVTGMSNDELESMLNRDSGLKGICGENDMREILKRARAGDDRARLAIEMCAYRIKKYIGAYYAVLGRLDAIVFTGGIGENAPEIRETACRDLEHLGIAIDPNRNHAHPPGPVEIQSDRSKVKVLVIPTDEEREIALHTVEAIGAVG